MKDYLMRNIVSVWITDADGQPVPMDILDDEGFSLLRGETDEAPVATGSIADQSLTVGGAVVVLELGANFPGATSFAFTPATPGVSVVATGLRIDPASVLAERTISVTGTNPGGTSEALTFKLAVLIAAPKLVQPLPDVDLVVGGDAVTLDLRQFIEGQTVAFSRTPALGTLSGFSFTLSPDAELAATDVTVRGQNTSGAAEDTMSVRFRANVPPPDPDPVLPIVTMTLDGFTIENLQPLDPFTFTMTADGFVGQL